MNKVILKRFFQRAREIERDNKKLRGKKRMRENNREKERENGI